ncbi:hypothetical protein F5884DRAFT_425031 [Xylogone sp. PMI_703]|nr:hypothetical protein F5884DRAFT_425031 [Xylogone sp. PMI_703]
MRVLLLGATGSLGSRLIPALLAHNHTLTIYVRNIPKLQSLIHPSLLSQATIVKGDATDSEGIKNALLEHDCDAVVDCAGNQVWPWKEYELPKIAKAVVVAAEEVGRMRGGKPVRAWLCGAVILLEYPGSGGKLTRDYLPHLGTVQHMDTYKVLKSTPTDSVQWSLLCVARVVPESPKVEPWPGPRPDNLIVSADVPPVWQDSWVRRIPFIGMFLNLLFQIRKEYTVYCEDAANLMAEDLASGSSQLVGKRVGYVDKGKSKNHAE